MEEYKPIAIKTGAILLIMNEEEARFLYDLLGGCVVGCSATSRRGVANRIWDALKESGVESLEGTTSIADLEGMIRCI